MDDLDPPLLTSHRLRHRTDEPSPSASLSASREEILLRRPRQVFQGYSHLPDIKFRWCRSIRCRAAEVTLVLTSVTGTQVVLRWRPDLGWYESAPTPLPLGHHTGFLLVRDKVRTPRGGRLARERDFKIDPFHVVPHCFAVELFITEDVACDFWGDRPNLRLRYLSSDHLVRLEEGASELIEEEDEENEDEQATQQLGKLSTSSLGSSGLGLGYEAQGPPSSQSADFRSRSRLSREKDFSSQWQLEYGKDVRSFRRSPRGPYRYYSEEGLHPRRLLFEREGKTARGRSFENSGRLFTFGESRRPLLSQTKDLIGTQLNLLRFSTLAQELQIAELLSGSRQSIDEASPGYLRVASDPDLAGPYSCLITFESRSQSMDDLGSPRALEEALVSLTSCGGDLKAGGTVSLPTQEQQVVPSTRSVMYLVPPDHDDPQGSREDSPVGISTPSEEGASPLGGLVSPSGRAISPTEGAISPAEVDIPMSPIHEQPSLESKTSQATVVKAGGSSSAGPQDTLERMDEEDPSSSSSQAQQQPPFLPICVVTSADSEGAMADVEYEYENFQYESLQHEEEHIPFNVRLLNDSEDSTDAVPPERDRRKRRAQAQLFLPEDNGDYTTGNEGDVEDGEEVGHEDSEDTAADCSEKGLDMVHERDVIVSQIEKIPSEIVEEKVHSESQPQTSPISSAVVEEIEEVEGDLTNASPADGAVASPPVVEVLPPPEEEEASLEDLTPVVPEEEDSHASGVSGHYSFGEEPEVKDTESEVPPDGVVLVKVGKEEEEEVKEKDDEDMTLSPQEESEPLDGGLPGEGEKSLVGDSSKKEGEEPLVGNSPKEKEPLVENSSMKEREEPLVGDSREELEGEEPLVGNSPEEIEREEPQVGDSPEIVEEEEQPVEDSPKEELSVEDSPEEELPVEDSPEEEGEERPLSVSPEVVEEEEPPIEDSLEEPSLGDASFKFKEGEKERGKENVEEEEELKEGDKEVSEKMEDVEQYEDLVDEEERDTEGGGGREELTSEGTEGGALEIVDEGWEETDFEIEKGAEESMEKDKAESPKGDDLPSEVEIREGSPHNEESIVTPDVPEEEEEEEAVEEEEEAIEEEEEVVEEEKYPVEDMRANHSPRDFFLGDDTTDISGDFMDLDRSIGEVTGSNSTRPPSEAVGYSDDPGGELGTPESVVDRPSGTSMGTNEKTENLDNSLDKPRTVPSKLDRSTEKRRIASDNGKGTSEKLSEIVEKPDKVVDRPRDISEVPKPSHVSVKPQKIVDVTSDIPEAPAHPPTKSNRTLVRQNRASEKSGTPSRTLGKTGDRQRKPAEATSSHTKGVSLPSNGMTSKPNGKRVTSDPVPDKPRVLPVKKSSGSGKPTLGKASEVLEKSRGPSGKTKKTEDKIKVDPSLPRTHGKTLAKASSSRGREEPTKPVLQPTKNLAGEAPKKENLNGTRRLSRSTSINGVEDTEDSLLEVEMGDETEDDHLFEEEEVEEEEEEEEEEAESEEWRGGEEPRSAYRSSRKSKSKPKKYASTGTQTIGSMKTERSEDPNQKTNNIDNDRYRNYSSSTVTSSSPVRHRSSLKNKRGKNYFVPLPNKFNGPWSYGKNLGGSYPSGMNSYSSSSVDLQTLQQNLYNLVQCDGSCIFNRGQTYANKAVVASFEPKKSQSSVGFDPVVQQEPKKSQHLRHHHHHHHHRTPTKSAYPGTSRPSITNGVASSGSPVRDTSPFSITRPRNGEPRSPGQILRTTAPILPRTFAVTSSPTRTIEVKRGQTPAGGRSLLPRDVLLAPGEMLKELRSSNGDYRSHRHRSSGMPSADCGVTVGHASSMPDLHHAASSATPSAYQLRHSPSRPTHHRHHATPPAPTTTPTATTSRHVRAASTPPVYFQPSAARLGRTYSLGRDYSWLAATGEESGGSTDSLIEEADRARAMAFQTPSYALGHSTDAVYSPPYRRRRRRRTRSSYSALPTTSFVTAAATSAPTYRVSDSFFRSLSLTKASSETDLRRAGTSGQIRITGVSTGLGDGGLPYLPYRSQHLFMGQRVKVMAPGGVSQAKVISTPSSSAVTVMLLTEPNSWTGVVVTLPVEKVLIAWPR
ncbi:uncharacterized protein LOC143023451 isoform X2 [Oratosquilla oratoria]|uniref:uncharacterized protein LOC143023451 isoform X2 n=1 Tax=Oratosquilla oratoria TaxID=337810 RepID=UPI003F75EFE6